MKICQVALSDSVCKSGTGTLYQGQNSKTKFGWVDADMAQAPAGCSIHRRTATGSWQNLGSGGSTGWVKIRGAFGITETLRVSC